MLKLHPSLSLSNLEKNMILIEGGTMEIQGVNIRLDDYEMCRYPVSQALWIEVLGTYPEKLYFKNPSRPVEGISWDDIQDKFLPALWEQTRDDSWCIPTETQWEYAARGGKYERSYVYSGSNQPKEVGWYDDNSSGETNPIACKRPNSLGLYGMSGNVEECCRNWYDGSYYQTLKDQYGDQPAPNPSGPEEGNSRVVRGGSWSFIPPDSRVSVRDFTYHNDRDDVVGFRLCRYSAR